MANPEHVEIVRGGADAIARWRESHPDERFDLEGADLRGFELSTADLSGANLQVAFLFRTDLARAQLHGANLREATLLSSNLTRANLDSADLRGTAFPYSNLEDATVSGANFETARFNRTILGNVDFSRARGLEAVEHTGPSVIDEATLRKSWPLPEIFLRGCGLSDELIGFARATYGKAIEFYSCFISYSSKDDEFARRLHADLQDNGVRCWFAPEDMKTGDVIDDRIDESIRLYDKLLLIFSRDSVESWWVEREVERAVAKERKAKERGEKRTVLFPIRLDAAVMETNSAWAERIRDSRNIGDFSAWKDHDAYQVAFQRLLRDLKSGGSEPGGD